jgi:hypothetical protein
MRPISDIIKEQDEFQDIRERHQKAFETKRQWRSNLPLVEVLSEVFENENDDQLFYSCHTSASRSVPVRGRIFSSTFRRGRPGLYSAAVSTS